MNQYNIPNLQPEQIFLNGETQQDNLKQFIISNECNSQKIKDTQSKVNFQLILQYTINEKCYTLDIDKSLSLIVIGGINGLILILKFQQNQLKVQKLVKAHRLVACIVVIKNSNQFISSGDQIIKIWSLQGIQLRLLQSLYGHSRPVRCLLISHNEDLIVSGGNDQKIKFWIRNANACKFNQQLLEHSNFICGISLNELQNQLISTAWEEPIIKISQQQPCKTWVVIQTIEVNLWGQRICFISEQMFSFQPFNGQTMHLYQFQPKNNIYALSKTIDVIQSKEGCTNLFPKQFIKQQSILINKNGECVNIILIKNNDECIIQQQIQFGHYCINGNISHDGQYLITWDLCSSQIQIRQNLNN
ncbi:unnamed protein product [Paramecium primaurelia]|uniref:Uncharacterized protein n=1 Tax=Paramecium primaurelia TaxID=5886 RepID=A0A8S1LZ07_PARPR|nr:unnamed protein product [Paramecium primaurelia]